MVVFLSAAGRMRCVKRSSRIVGGHVAFVSFLPSHVFLVVVDVTPEENYTPHEGPK